MLKVLTIIGTRPEAIKMAPLILELRRHPEQFDSRLCVTGQHRQMLDQVLAMFGLTPDHDLDIMRPSQTLNGVMSNIIQGLDPVLETERPDWVLIQGDTTTAMAASMVAFHRHIRVGHVEAGLRTHNLGEPFPEEFNRRVVSLTTDLHFAPTEWAAENLRREMVPDHRIAITGNTVIDALRHAAAMPFDVADSCLGDIPVGRQRLVLVTCHRRENHGDRLVEICKALARIARTHEDIHLVFPVHLNPRVREPVYRYLSAIPNVTLLEPLDYQPLVWLLSQSHLVITDSGGLQEEAPGFGKPVLVLRETTERPEGVTAGTVQLVGASGDRLEWLTHQLLTDDVAYRRMAHATNPYGDGKAAGRIVDALLSFELRESVLTLDSSFLHHIPGDLPILPMVIPTGATDSRVTALPA